jgi:hypothetical protein
MKRLLWPILFVLACAVPAFAQNPNIINPSPQTVTTATNSSCATRVGAAVWDVTAVKSIGLQVSNTFSGTLTFKTTTDGTNWNTTTLMDLSDGSADTTTTGTGQWSIVNTGIQGICAQATAWASGTATITALFGNGGSFIVPVGAIAPSSANYWIATANAALPNAKVLGALGTGLVFNTTTTGTPTVVVCATAGTVLVGGAPPTCSASPTVTSIQVNSLIALGNGSRLNDSSDGVFQFRTSAAVGGIVNVATNSTFKFFALDGTTPAALQAGTITTSAGFVATSGNLRLRADAGIFTFGVNDDITLLRQAAGVLGLQNDSTHGVTFNVATDSVFKLFGRDGTTPAIIQSSHLQLQGQAYVGFNDQFYMRKNGTNQLELLTNAFASSSVIDISTVGTFKVLNTAAADTATLAVKNITSSGTITFAGLASSTGVRYVCANTTGVLDGQAAACVGTEATVQQYAKDGYMVLTLDEYRDFQAMRSQFKFSGIVR